MKLSQPIENWVEFLEPFLKKAVKELKIQSVSNFTYNELKAHLKRHPTISKFRSSAPEVFLVKGVLKICSKFTEEHPCRSVISIKSQSKATYLKSHFGMSVLM